MAIVKLTIGTSVDYDPASGHPPGKHFVQEEGQEPILCDNASEVDAVLRNFRRDAGIPNDQ